MEFMINAQYLKDNGKNKGVDDVKEYTYPNVTTEQQQVGYKCRFSFAVSNEFEKDCFPKLSAKAKSMMYYYMLKYRKNIIFVQDKEANYGQYEAISFDELNNDYPTNISQRIYMILENMSNYNPYIGTSFLIGKTKGEMEKWPEILWLFMPEKDDIDEAWGVYTFLLKSNYLDIYTDENTTDSSHAIFTEKAWSYITPKGRNNSKKIFIAMSYNDIDKLRFYEKAAKAAVVKCGYIPMIIKDKEHTNYIPVEIEYEISHALVVIADLTENNNGVYYEAGFARGKKVPVIFSAYKEVSRHFDVSQINTIFWQYDENNTNDENEEKLIDRLVSRIKAILDD